MARTVFDQTYTAENTAVTTTNATTTTVLLLNVPPGAVGTVDVWVNARSSAGFVRCFKGSICVERPVNGSARSPASMPFGLTPSGGDLGAATWVAQIDIVSNQVRVRVTGLLATSVEWWAAAQVYWGGVVPAA